MTAPLLSPYVLDGMRATQAANMPSACDLIAYSDARGTQGETVRTAIIAATSKCRLVIAGASDPIVAAQREVGATFVLVLPYGTDLSDIERFIVRGPDATAPAWEVQLVAAGSLEPRTYSASVRVNVTQAPTNVDTSDAVATVTVTEA